MLQKIKYLLTCVKKTILNTGFNCPSCDSKKSEVISRKYIISSLRRCSNCQLLFRTPTTSAKENAQFYQEDYTQEHTTAYPSNELLQQYMQENFASMHKDYSNFIDIICAAGGKKGDRLFDFGCSWGYGSWQFSKFGFNVESFEISRPRADYARTKLNVNVHNSLPKTTGDFDIFFSSHVMEHVPSVKETIEFGMRLLKPGGLFITLTPNGSSEYKHTDFGAWDKLWGMVHPNFIDHSFYSHTFKDNQPFVASEPYDLKKIKQWHHGQKFTVSTQHLAGCELLVLVKK